MNKQIFIIALVLTATGLSNAVVSQAQRDKWQQEDDALQQMKVKMQPVAVAVKAILDDTTFRKDLSDAMRRVTAKHAKSLSPEQRKLLRNAMQAESEGIAITNTITNPSQLSQADSTKLENLSTTADSFTAALSTAISDDYTIQSAYLNEYLKLITQAINDGL